MHAEIDATANAVQRWAAQSAEVGGDPVAGLGLARALLASWGQPDRHYHDLQHLRDCLFELDALQSAGVAEGGADRVAAAPAVELALWYLDAVYNAKAHDNEERSALRLIEELRAVGVDAEVVAAAARLVRATAHLGRPSDQLLAADEALVVDIDLSILGQHPLRFSDFEDGIAQEYAAIPKAILRLKRGRFLRRLLGAPQLFSTPALRTRHEAVARANLRKLLSECRYTWWGFWM